MQERAAPKGLTFDASKAQRTLLEAVLDARDKHGKDRIALEDADGVGVSYGRLVIGALALGRKLEALTRRGDNVAVMLPGVPGAVVVMLALSAYGRVPALLNFTAGARNLTAAIKIARSGVIVTSRKFIDTAKLEDVLSALEAVEIQRADGSVTHQKVVFVEDLRAGLSKLDLARAALRALRARGFLKKQRARPSDTGVLLFTSGSEGVPKGVVLSHANLVANTMQIWSHAAGELKPSDLVVNPLPLFHSYGLTAGTLLGLFHGMKVVLYPSPLHYRQVPKLIAKVKATLLFATDTFLRGYARAADKEDIKTVRLVIAGAERVKEDTRALWGDTTILEGYGATECAPVIAVNLPWASKDGTVGTLLPGIEAALEPVDGIPVGGKLRVKGPNVMKGYIFADRPGELVPPEDGWHDTGDIVAIDGEGFIAIQGRAKRFAKLGGEMVSLAAVESMAASLWEDANHVALTLADKVKGEQIMLVSDKPQADREALMKHARAQGFPELWVPRTVLVVPHIPILASGKVDFVATQELAAKMRPML